MTRRHRKKLPTIWLMTDERVTETALIAAASLLPKGQGGIVFRHYHTPSGLRHQLFRKLAAIAKRRRLKMILAGSRLQAAAWGAEGWHGRGKGRSTRPMIHTIPVHDERELRAALGAGADLIFLSPLFPTRSHPGGRALGRVRFAALARLSNVPVIALGGVHGGHRHMLAQLGASGWAAIDGLTKVSRPKR